MANILMCYSNTTIVNMYSLYGKLVYKIIVNGGGYRITYFVLNIWQERKRLSSQAPLSPSLVHLVIDSSIGEKNWLRGCEKSCELHFLDLWALVTLSVLWFEFVTLGFWFIANPRWLGVVRELRSVVSTGKFVLIIFCGEFVPSGPLWLLWQRGWKRL